MAVDLLDQPLIVTRDERGALHVLSRVCRHRGAILAEGSGNTSTLRCPYHAWVYRLDGTLAGAPYMESAVAFESQHCALPELRSEVWEGFVNVSHGPSSAPLAPRLVTLARVLARYRARHPTRARS